MWKLRNIYLYLVCFVTLMIMIFSVVGIVGGIYDLFLPSPDPFVDPTLPQVDPFRATLRGIITDSVLLLIAAPLFWFHWRTVQKEKHQDLDK